MAVMSADCRIEVSRIAKMKTGLQMTALILLIYASKSASPIWDAGVSLLVVSILFSLYSALNYLKTAWPALTFGSKQQ